MSESTPLKGTKEQPKGLRYVGDGAALAGVPARDLSYEDITDLAALSIDFGDPNQHTTASALRRKLIASGLYEEA